MPIFFVACESAVAPSVVVTGPGRGTLNCPTAHIVVEYSSTIFQPLTVDQGLQISGALLSVWALAYVFRLCIRLLSSSNSSEMD